MSSHESLVKALLSIFILQVTTECFASNPHPHPFANLQFTPKEEYYNNYPTGQPRPFSYNVPFPGGMIRFANYPNSPSPMVPPGSIPPPQLPPPPPPPSQPQPFPMAPFPTRYYVQDPHMRDSNYIGDDDDFVPGPPKNMFKPGKEHFLHKREVIRPKAIPKPSAMQRNKLLQQKVPVASPGPAAPPGTFGMPGQSGAPCNCNYGGYFGL